MNEERPSVWDIDAARAALAALRPSGVNIDVAKLWLSLWRDGAPPTFCRFEAHLPHALVPAMMIFEIHRGVSLICIKSGDYSRLALGFDMTGQSLLSLTNNVDREDRLDWCWKIVEGAATVSYRAFKPQGSASIYAQGLSLPFSDRPPEGRRYFFSHSNWRPTGNDWIEGSVDTDLQRPRQRAMRSFAVPEEKAATRKAAG